MQKCVHRLASYEEPAAPAKKGVLSKKIKLVIKDRPVQKSRQGMMPLEKPDDQPRDDEANEWDGQRAPGGITLEQLPKQLQELLFNEVSMTMFPALIADQGLLKSIRDGVKDRVEADAIRLLSSRLETAFVDKFGTNPGAALANFVRHNVTITTTITIQKKDQ